MHCTGGSCLQCTAHAHRTTQKRSGENPTPGSPPREEAEAEPWERGKTMTVGLRLTRSRAQRRLGAVGKDALPEYALEKNE
jgi:hypothetical protein